MTKMTNKLRMVSKYDCSVEVPLHWVRGNQLGILLSVVVAIGFDVLWILALPLAVQIISRTFGIRYNVFVRVFALLLPASSRTESRELLRFNQLLAILFLVGALTAHALNVAIVSYVFVGMLTAAVVLALSGFCLGCFMYFQWKQFRARRAGAR